MGVKVSTQKFLEGLLSLGVGMQQGQQKGREIAFQRQQEEQHRLASMLPHLLRMEEQRRQAATAPLEMALQDPNLDPSSRQGLFTQYQQVLQQQPDYGALQAKAAAGQLTPQDFAGYQGTQYGGTDFSGVKFRDPERQRKEAELLQEKRLNLRQAASRYQNPAAFNPYLEQGELPAPQPFSGTIPVPGGMGARVPVAGTPTSFVPSGAGELVDDVNFRQLQDQERLRQHGQEARDKRLDEREAQKSAARLQLENLKLGAKAAKDRTGFQAQARKWATDIGYSPEQAQYFFDQAGLEFDAAHGKGEGAPGAAPKLEGQTPAQAEVALKQAKAADMAKRTSILEKAQVNLDQWRRDGLAWKKQFETGKLNLDRIRTQIAQAKQKAESGLAAIENDPTLRQDAITLRGRIARMESFADAMHKESITGTDPEVRQRAGKALVEATKNLNGLLGEYEKLRQRALGKPDEPKVTVKPHQFSSEEQVDIKALQQAINPKTGRKYTYAEAARLVKEDNGR